jgi:hypothetical protein
MDWIVNCDFLVEGKDLHEAASNLLQYLQECAEDKDLDAFSLCRVDA